VPSHRLSDFPGDFTYWTSDLTRRQVIEKMSHIVAVYPFRTRWGYTNAAFVAGKLFQKQVNLRKILSDRGFCSMA
jgi:hypothetical protein